MSHDSKTAHRFGGNWTDTKLEVIAKYLTAYTTALKKQQFATIYVDAFAGTGYRTPRTSDRHDVEVGSLFPDLGAEESQALLDGSARIALRSEPRFNEYVFIERKLAHCDQLEALKAEFPALSEDVRIIPGEANAKIEAFCTETVWTKHRAVLFLDPYGMQVEWTTIQAIARTQAIDLWLLVPFGMGLNRLLKRDGEIPPVWRARLDKFLGTTDWYDALYPVKGDQPVQGEQTSFSFLPESGERREKVDLAGIGRYFVDRLKTEFSAVAEPAVLTNSSNNPLYLLCFAANNPTGGPIALRIAKHILRKV